MHVRCLFARNKRTVTLRNGVALSPGVRDALRDVEESENNERTNESSTIELRFEKIHPPFPINHRNFIRTIGRP